MHIPVNYVLSRIVTEMVHDFFEFCRVSCAKGELEQKAGTCWRFAFFGRHEELENDA
jgi:hypothetical protein